MFCAIIRSQFLVLDAFSPKFSEVLLSVIFVELCETNSWICCFMRPSESFLI
jgi:hypothetical protein